MKKLLLASTAVVMSAGVAAADVALSGDAWMGLRYTSNATPEVQMISRARVTFTMSGETDSGMAFGASFRADNAPAAALGTGGAVYISGDFGKLSMGDVSSALDATSFRTRHIGVLENGGAGARTAVLGQAGNLPAALYEFSMDGFKAALSVGQFTGAAATQVYSIGASYTMDGFGVGLGYEQNGSNDSHVLISGQANFDPVSVRAFYGQRRTGGVNTDQYGLDVHASFDEITVQLRATRDFANATHLGAGVVYDLGGGAKLGASINNVSAGNVTTADVGLAFSF